MYAIFESGGKQTKAAPGDRVRVEKLEGDVGVKVEFTRVLLLNDGERIQVGTPYVDGVRVTGTVLAQGKARKVLVFKKKKRKQYRRTRGHRQSFTAVHIDSIGT